MRILPFFLLAAVACSENTLKAYENLDEEAGPVVEILSPTDGEIYAHGTTIVFEGNATDTEDAPEAITVNWASSLEGTLGITVIPDSNGDFVGVAELTAGQHLITLTGTDTSERTDVANVMIIVNEPKEEEKKEDDDKETENHPPGAPEVAITPVQPVAGTDDLQCAVVVGAEDEDGDTVTYDFIWDVDGLLFNDPKGVTDLETMSIVTGDITITEEVWTCTVVPFDGTETGTAAEDSVVIAESESSGDGTVEGSRRVFVTSSGYNGNLGGLAGADQICQDHADGASLGGTWMAWLSDSTTDAADRLVHPTGSLLRTDGVVVAKSWAELVLTWPLNAPEVTEHGTSIPYVDAGSTGHCSWAGSLFFHPWTATDNDGIGTGTTCSDWTTTAGTGLVGLGGYSLSQWTYWCDFPCDGEQPLYCFEQE